jgi:GGDEF domain-containing protein
MDINQDIAAKLAEELRMLVEQSTLHNECGITISFGVAVLEDHESQQDGLNRADAALY